MFELYENALLILVILIEFVLIFNQESKSVKLKKRFTQFKRVFTQFYTKHYKNQICAAIKFFKKSYVKLSKS